MSNQTNDQLYDEARDMIDYWEGTQHAARIRQAVADKDIDNLYLYVREAKDAMNMLEHGMDNNGTY